MEFPKTIALIKQAIAEGAYPCAAFAVGKGDEVYTRISLGDRSIWPERKPITENTKFDMASLSKILGPTMLMLRAIEDGKVLLTDPLSRFFDPCYDKGDVTIKNLMTHTSGLYSPVGVFLRDLGIRPDEVIDFILKQPYDFPTGTQVQYSCMNYFLLAAICEKLYGMPLDEAAEKYTFGPLGMKDTGYNPTSGDFATTEFDPGIGRYCDGFVHDENARFIGGVSGNAGVFSTLDDCIKFAAMLSKHGEGIVTKRTFEAAIRDYTPDFDESRGLGFQLYTGKPCPTGDLFSLGSYGHTGFTGTSIYVDADTGIYIVLLTNRVHPGRSNSEGVRYRRAIENCTWKELCEQGLV